MGRSIGMAGRGFFARLESSSKPGLVLLLLGFVMIIVGAVEGQNISTTNEPSQPVAVNISYNPILNGQLAIHNSESTTISSTTFSSTESSSAMTTGQLVNNSTLAAQTTISSSSVGSSAGTTVPPSSSPLSSSPLATSPGVTNPPSTSPVVTSTSPLANSTSSAVNNSSTVEPPIVSSVASAPVASSPVVTPGQALYAKCQQKKGIVCFGDKRDCIHSGNCTFLGAISENDSFINVQLLTRTYNPPYHGVNLTVELSREKKGNDSVIRCSRPRFKSFKIRLSWTNKTTYEPGNEMKLSNTLIDKNQLKAECLADQEKSNFTIPPSKTLALKFYIENKNDSSSTLVSQGLSQVSIQEPIVNNSSATDDASSRTGRKLDFDTPPAMSKEDSLYEMCLKNTARCFGDKPGCTGGHNCSFLGVIKETPSNYHVYVVTKAYPLVDQILTLALNTPSDSLNTTTQDMNNSTSPTSEIDCGKPDVKDLTVQSTWSFNKLPLALLSQNASNILETTVDKMQIKSNCESYLQEHQNNLNSTMNNDIMEDANGFFLRFHLENGTLVPLGFSSNGTNTGNLTNENGIFEIGLNGTAYLVSDNKNAVIPVQDDDSSQASPVLENSSTSLQTNFMSYFILCLSASITIIYSSL